jgi:aryl-alcohol dehydrogenase-like predicted oxidoreductase
MNMQQKQLGKTELKVSKIGFGGLFVASSNTEFDDAKSAVARALELGINYFDTAPGYGNSEEVLGKALIGVKQPIILSTKLGGRPTPFLPQDKACLRASLEESLRLLGRDCIDILLIHEPERPGQYDWWTDIIKVEGPVLELITELKAEGKIRYSGLGGTTTTEMAHLCESGKFDIILTAFNYSLLYREATLEVIPAAKKAGMGIIIGLCVFSIFSMSFSSSEAIKSSFTATMPVSSLYNKGGIRRFASSTVEASSTSTPASRNPGAVSGSIMTTNLYKHYFLHQFPFWHILCLAHGYYSDICDLVELSPQIRNGQSDA